LAPEATRPTLADVAAAVEPSVVSITVQGTGGEVEGSGVVLSSDGLILTNNHVVADAGQGGRVQVQLSGDSTATAVVVGTSPGSDLAVLRADGASGLTAATFGDSDALEVGDTVLAVGSIGVGFAIPSQRVAQVVGQLTGDTQMLATSSATG
jgi:putative serine protease PepD